jgi:hypothetical protein
MLKDPKKYRYIIGIDPSISSNNSKKTGICIYDQKEKKFNIFDINAANMIIDQIKEKTFFELPKEECLVLIENSNQSKRIRAGYNSKYSARINQNAGKNLGVSELICKIFEAAKINFNSLPPNGYSKLFEDADFFKKILGLEKAYNKDVRSAVAIIYKNIDL